MPLGASHPYTLQLPAFEGPLDLLLRLIEKHELAITAISLTLVTDQYLEHVRSLEAPDPAALAEFLALAAQLLLIKSRALLPRPDPAPANGEEDPAEQLARQLREYQQFKQAAARLRTWELEGQRSFEQQATPERPTLTPPQLKPHSVSALVNAIQRRLALLTPEDPPLAIPRPRTITIAEVTALLVERLSRQPFCSLEDLLDLTPTRAAIIVTLWTVLELLKREVISVEQEDLFGTITLGRGERFDQPNLASAISDADNPLQPA